ncbi:MAG: helix-turn-helix domain-containing protein [Acidimicrobiales bacterium]|jgi:AcrR family transcriptional regulator
MVSNRRIGAEDSKSRAALLDAAEQIMLEEGYAAVSSRRIAERAELKPQLVHYYFRTMDDLFLAAFRRRAEIGLGRLTKILESGQPLRALWDFGDDPTGTALNMEFVALANHRKAIRSEIARYGELFRAKQAAALAAVMEERGIDTDRFPPLAVMTVMTGVSQILVLEESLGMDTGHAETRAMVARLLDGSGRGATP